MSAIDILIAIIALPCLFYIPGFVAFRAFNVHKIESLKLSLFESIFLQVLASIVITGWIAFILAEAGCFSLWLLIVILEVGSFIVFAIFRSRFSLPKFSKPRFNIQSVFLLLVIVLAGLLFFHPFQDVTLFYDAGPMVNSGVHIAKTGSITIHDDILAGMPESIQPVFYQMRPESAPQYYALQFKGFGLYVTDLDNGTILPQYLQLFPAWTAIFYSLFGLYGFLYVNPLFGILAIITIYLLAKLLFNKKIGLICALLLVVNFIQIWFARYPGAEILFQLQFFGGLLALILFNKTSNRFFGLLAGTNLGLLLFTRVDALFVLIPIIGYLIYLKVKGRLEKKYMYFFVPYFVLFGHSMFYYFTLAYPYIHGQLAGTVEEFRNSFGWFPILGVLFLCVLGLIAIYIYKRSNKFNIYFKHAVVLGSIVLMAVAYITAPTARPGILGSNLIMLGWYLTDLVVILGLLGLILMTYSRSTTNVLFLLFVIVFIVLYIIHIQNQVIQPWCMRRYITVVIPALFIGAGYIFFKIRDRVKAQIIYVTIAIFFLLNFSISGLAVAYVENEGIVDQIGEFSDYFQDDSIIICGQVVYSDVAFPLKYIYDKNAILMPKEPTEIGDIDKFLDMCAVWLGENRDVYLVNPSQEFYDTISSDIEIKHFVDYTLETTLLEYTEARSTIIGARYNAEDTTIEFPQKIQKIAIPIVVYELKLKQ